MNRVEFTKTASGVVIGGHYSAPPPAPSKDAEFLQAALLNRSPNYAMRVLDVLERNIGRVCVGMIVLGLVAGVVKGLLS